MFQQRLRWARKQKSLTIEELAHQIGVAKSTYANYELNNREPSLSTLLALSRALDVSVDYLLGLSDNPQIHSIETNAKLYLQSPYIHWDGVQLEEELKMVRDFLDYIMVKKTTSPDIQQEASVERKIK
jgi:transcriptional regulator with XRE-family HTH domain